MTMLDEILDSIPHDSGCACHTTVRQRGMPLHYNCDCTRRRKVKYLERLKELTPEMRDALIEPYEIEDGYKAMLAKAEEGL